MTVAFVLPGGASLGACQVGMLEALHEAGVAADILIGSSAGAINAAYLGLHPGAEGLAGMARLWTSFRRRDLIRIRPAQVTLGLLGRRQAIFDRSGMERMLARELGAARLEDMDVPVIVVAADVISGEAVTLRAGPALGAVLASSAMPGIFAPVPWRGRWLVDGSVAADAPVAQAQDLGADVVYVLSTTVRPPRPPRGALDLAVHAFTLVTGTATAAQLERARERGTVHVLPPPVVDDPGVFDFSRAPALIAESRRNTMAWLDRAPGTHVA
ncbi:MAG: patatin-like phospholipase family protein [Acidimicrobiales bacterium]